MQIVPLCDALGAEVRDLDATRPLEAEAVAALREAFLTHHLLCLRAAPLTPADFARLARHFGSPQLQLLRDQRDPEVPEVSILKSTYETAADKPDDLTQVRLSGWHTDDSYFARPAKATLLQGLAIPTAGGETKFANTEAAYRDLPETRRRQLDGLKAVHGYNTRRAPAQAKQRSAVETGETPDVVHPLIRTHEESGAKAIYFNPNRTDRIEGMTREESDALLDDLYAHITAPKYQYHHRWRVGDVVFWDNRCLIHAVNTDYPVGQERRHQRVLLEGTTPA
ncbi:MAG: TauD/TfdA family dioxygenase [Alphaproteobacteria bacterium]|jgi:taurine dioxygenase|nr:TauD/TfdA family dioxygenase [Alphaproteobacteria bacterium]